MRKAKIWDIFLLLVFFRNIKHISGFRKSCSVRKKLFEDSTYTALTPNLLGISTFLGFLKSGGMGGGFKQCNSHVTAYIALLKFLQVSVISITHFNSVIALYMPVLLFKHCHSVESIDSISVDTDPTDTI